MLTAIVTIAMYSESAHAVSGVFCSDNNCTNMKNATGGPVICSGDNCTNMKNATGGPVICSQNKTGRTCITPN